MAFYIFALISMVVIVHSDNHFLQYYYTAVSAPGSGLPEFSIVGYVNDHQLDLYSSDIGRARPVATWMNKEGPDYWDRQTQIAKGTEPVFRHNVKTVMSRFNQTGGFHSFQVMYGCELRDDGSTAGYRQYGYDGRDFMSLDTQRGIYIPTMNEAQITTQRWNSPEMREGERYKNYLENECIPALKRYMEYGREDLERRVRPEGTVWGRPQSDGVTRLQCLVYGFHPRAVDVKWVRNGVDHVSSDQSTPILPHPDGTYQIIESVEVPTGTEDAYSCHVEHSSLEETLIVKYDKDRGYKTANNPDSGVSLTVIIAIACVVIALVAAAVGFGIFWHNKKKRGYKTASTADTNSDSSNNPKA